MKINRIPDLAALLIYLFLSFFLVYFVGLRMNRVIFLLVLPAIWFSRKDYIWIAFLLILLEMPGGLFSGGLRDDPFRLPIYTFLPGISFSIQELIILVFFAKSLFNKKVTRHFNPPFFRKELKLLFWLYIIDVLISPLLGMSLASMSNVFKLSISLTLFYSVLRLINSEEQFIQFLKLMFPFAFIALGLQIYGLLTGEQLIALFKPGVSTVQGSYNIASKSETWIRPIEMAHAIFITFTGSLYLLLAKKHTMNKNYLVIVNLISFLVIFMTGTRSWVLAFIAGYIAFFLFAGSRTPKLIINSVIVLIVAVLMVSGIPVINKQVKNAYSRFATVETVFEGDITGGGTISRYDIRAPRVMEGFKSSTIILGAGFSDHFYNYADGHVGYHNMLLNAGILGFIVFIYVGWRVLSTPSKIARTNKCIDKPLLKISIIPFVILMIINTGTQTLGFTPDGISRIVLMIYSLLIIDIAIRLGLKNT